MLSLGSQFHSRQYFLGFLKASRRELHFHGGKLHQEQPEASVQVILPSRFPQIHELDELENLELLSQLLFSWWRTITFDSQCHTPTVYTNSSSCLGEEGYQRRAAWTQKRCHGGSKRIVSKWATFSSDVLLPPLVHSSSTPAGAKLHLPPQQLNGDSLVCHIPKI